MQKALPLSDARALVLASELPPPVLATVPLAEAHGRYLAEPVFAAEPWPSTDRSAMDGFAVAAGAAGLPAGTVLPVVGESLAGRPFTGALPASRAIRIMTGAVVPEGADAVLPVEQTSGFAGDQVVLQAPVAAGANVRRRGSEVVPGQQLLARGQRLGAAEIGALAVLGRTQVPVHAPVVVAIVATGDEVVPVEQHPLPHQVRESNSWAVAAQVHECGAVPLRLGIAPDEPQALRQLLERGLAAADLLVTIGGISKGTHDLVHQTLGDLGVRTVFHGLDLKPGKPTYFGTAAGSRARFVFGLPGNPASSFTVFDLLVRPLLVRLAGGDPGELRARVAVGGTPWQPNARLQAIPARLQAAADGGLQAHLAAPSPSGDPFAVLGADGYVLVPGRTAPGPLSLPWAGGSRGVVLP